MRVFSAAPSLQPAFEADVPETSICVVIPAYNEALNVGPCLTSVLRSATPCRDWRVLLVDDASLTTRFNRLNSRFQPWMPMFPGLICCRLGRVRR